MTSPGGADGLAYVEIQAALAPGFEEKLARSLKRIATRRGRTFGEDLGKNFLSGFRTRLRADLPKYERLGAQAGRAVRRGFKGEVFGTLAAQDFIRGVRRGLARADLKVGALTPADTSGIERAEKASLDRRRRTFRSFTDDVGRDFQRIQLPDLKFGRRGGLGIGNVGALVSLTPALANLFQSVRNLTGGLFGLFPAVTGAAGLFALFQGRNVRLLAAVKPVGDALDKVRINLDGIAAAAARGGLAVLATDVAKLKPGLEAFAAGFGTALGNISKNLATAGAGASLSRALASIGQAFQALTSGPGVSAFFSLLLRINEQVSATLPALFLRLQGFLNGLEQKFQAVDFGRIFTVAVQGAIDLGASVINLIIVLNRFFAAVSGSREQGTFFAVLRQRLGELATFLSRADVVSGINGFFEAVRKLGSALATVVIAIAPFVGKVLELVAASVAWLDANDALLPVLVGLGAAIAVIQLAPLVAAMVAAGPIALGVVAAIAALSAAFTYANTSSSDLATVIRGVLNAALSSAVQPISLLLGALAKLFEGLEKTAAAAGKIPGIGGKFDRVALGARRAADEINGVRDSINSLARIEGPGPRKIGPGFSQEDKDFIAAAEQRTAAAKAAAAAEKANAAFLSDLRSGFASTGVRDTRSKGGGGTAAAAAKREAVDLNALLEQLSERLNTSLRQGGSDTVKAFADMRKQIISTLRGTAQEGRTAAALAVLDRMRSDAVAAANSYAQISNAVDATTDRLRILRDEQDQFKASVLETLRATGSISTFLSDRPGGSVASFGRFLAKDVARLTKFQADLGNLLKRGLDASLVRDLAVGGDFRFAAKLAASSPAQLALLNKLSAQVAKLSAGTANLTGATFQSGIDRVAGVLDAQLLQQRKQSAQLDRLAHGLAAAIAAAIKGRPLPKFARGGIATRASIFGEAGPELAVPLRASQRSRDVEKLLAAIAARSGGSGNGKVVHIESQTFQLPQTVDPRALAKEIDRRQAQAVR